MEETKNKKDCCESKGDKVRQSNLSPDLLNAVFTCPMHPEVQQIGPGSCPSCGMALEPKEQSLQVENEELKDFKKRFLVSGILTLPIFLSEMLSHLFGVKILFPASYVAVAQLILSTVVLFWAGKPFLIRGLLSIKNKSLNMFTLISIGTVAAWLYSLIALLLSDSFPDTLKSSTGTVPLYFEAASVIIVLVLLGQIMELKAREQTSGAIKSLLELAPQTANLVESGQEKVVNISEVKKGNNLRIKPGEKFPVDGCVIEGESSVDESMITGEPMPVMKFVDSKVIAGTINNQGAILIKAESVGDKTMLSQIIKMVTNAQRSKAPIQRLADKVASWFVPIVLLASIITFLSWFFLADSNNLSFALITSVSVLIIACPCALGLATPMSIMVGVGRGAKEGVLVKNAQALEITENLNVLVVDKTGTLTKGQPEVSGIYTVNKFPEDKLLAIAGALEQNSEHPIAKSILKKCKEREVSVPKIDEFKSITGKGVQGKLGSSSVLVGNERFLIESKIDTGSLKSKVNEQRQQGATVVYIACDGTLIGIIAVGDLIKETAYEALQDLKSLGVKIVMLTGDNLLTAKSVADKLGIEEVYADVLPAEKSGVIEKLKAKGLIIGMAGDGVNDAPALTLADVGIAMGTGTDVAMESSDITLIKGDLRGIVKSLNLSKVVMRNIRQNLFFAFAYNIAGIPLAAGLLYSITGSLLSPVFAAAAMSLSSVSVVLNSLRLKNQKI